MLGGSDKAGGCEASGIAQDRDYRMVTPPARVRAHGTFSAVNKPYE